MARNQKDKNNGNGRGQLGFEAQLWATADKMRGHMDTNAASTGTKMPRANWNDISRYDVALPPQQFSAEFTEKIRPHVERIISNIHESRTLAALLPGELRVPQWQYGQHQHEQPASTAP